MLLTVYLITILRCLCDRLCIILESYFNECTGYLTFTILDNSVIISTSNYGVSLHNENLKSYLYFKHFETVPHSFYLHVLTYFETRNLRPEIMPGIMLSLTNSFFSRKEVYYCGPCHLKGGQFYPLHKSPSSENFNQYSLATYSLDYGLSRW